MAAQSLSEIVYLLVQQKRQLVQKSVNRGVYEALDRVEAARRTLQLPSDEYEYRTSSIQVRRGSIISSTMTDFKGDDFHPFEDTSVSKHVEYCGNLNK